MYSIVKNRFKGKFKINYDKIKGFKVKPRNKVNKGLEINKLTVTNPSFIDGVLKKKTQKKLELYLNYIISIIDDEENTDPDGVRMALDDLERYKGIVEYRYSKYLDELYTKLLLKKIDLLKRELKKKIIKLEYNAVGKDTYDDLYEEKSRRSR